MVDKKLLMVCLTPLILGLNAESFSAEVSESNQQVPSQEQAQSPAGQNAFAAAFGDDQDDDEGLQPMPEQAAPQMPPQPEQASQQPEVQQPTLENGAENLAEVPQPPMDMQTRQEQILPTQQQSVVESSASEVPAQMTPPAIDMPPQEQQAVIEGSTLAAREQQSVAETSNSMPQEQQSIIEGNSLAVQAQSAVEGTNFPQQGQPILPEPQSANVPVVNAAIPGTQPEAVSMQAGTVPTQQTIGQSEEGGMLDQLFVNKEVISNTPADTGATQPVATPTANSAVVPAPATTPAVNTEQPQVVPTAANVEQPATAMPQAQTVPVVPNVEPAVTMPQPQVSMPVAAEPAIAPRVVSAPVNAEQIVVPQTPAVIPAVNTEQPQVVPTVANVEQPATAMPQAQALSIPAAMGQTIPTTIQAETEKAADIISSQATQKLEHSAAINEEVKEGVSAVKEDVGDINEKINGMLSVLEDQKKQNEELKENIDILTNIVAERRERELAAPEKLTEAADADDMREISRDDALAMESKEVVQSEREIMDGEKSLEKFANDKMESAKEVTDAENGTLPEGIVNKAEIAQTEFEDIKGDKSIADKEKVEDVSKAVSDVPQEFSREELVNTEVLKHESMNARRRMVKDEAIPEADTPTEKAFPKREGKHFTEDAISERKKAKEDKARLAAENREMVGQILKELQIIKEGQQENTKDLKNIKEKIASNSVALETVARHQEHVMSEQASSERKEVVSPKEAEAAVKTGTEIAQKTQVDSPRQEAVVIRDTKEASTQGQEQQSSSPSPDGSSQNKVAEGTVQTVEAPRDSHTEAEIKQVQEIAKTENASTKPAVVESGQEPVVTQIADETPGQSTNSSSNELSRGGVAAKETQIAKESVNKHAEADTKKVLESTKAEDASANPEIVEVAHENPTGEPKQEAVVSQNAEATPVQTQGITSSGTDVPASLQKGQAEKSQAEDLKDAQAEGTKVDTTDAPKSQEKFKPTEISSAEEAKSLDSTSSISKEANASPEQDVKTVDKENVDAKSASDAEPQKKEQNAHDEATGEASKGDKSESAQDKSVVSDKAKGEKDVDTTQSSVSEEKQEEKKIDEKSDVGEKSENNTSVTSIDEKVEKTSGQSTEVQKEENGTKNESNKDIKTRKNVSAEKSVTTNEVIPHEERQKTTNNSTGALHGVEQTVKIEEIADASKQLVNSLEELAQIKTAISEAMKAAK